MMHEGRPKPLSTVARNILQVTAEPLFGATATERFSGKARSSAIEWLLALMAIKTGQPNRQCFECMPRKLVTTSI